MADDEVVEVAAALQELQDAAVQHQALAAQVRVGLYTRLVESRAAVGRSRALLQRLDARKPPRFP